MFNKKYKLSLYGAKPSLSLALHPLDVIAFEGGALKGGGCLFEEQTTSKVLRVNISCYVVCRFLFVYRI
jgi:hypothetical protein